MVFAIAEHVAAVAFAVNVGDAFSVAEEDARFAPVAEGASVPDFDGGVVGARVEDMRGRLVAVADGVDVVLVAVDAEDGLPGFEVVDVDAVVGCAGYDFAAVA